MMSVFSKALSECNFVMICHIFFFDMSLLFSISCEQIVVFRSNKSASNFFEKNCCCSTFILSSKFSTKYQLRLKSNESVLQIFSEEMMKQMNKVRLNVHFHFASFHIKLKLIATECKMLLKCSVQIRCTILLCFFLALLIFFSD